MTIPAEKLSAYLDGELSSQETAEVREALQHDEKAAAVLAAMVMVDERIQRQVDAQAQEEIPAHLTRLLDEAAPDKVVAGPWKKRQHWIQHPAAVAASVALIIGLGTGSWLTDSFAPNANSQLQERVVQVLEQKPSGQTYQLDADVAVTPQLTFKNHAGHYCRHYELYNAAVSERTLAIQCRQSGDWKVVAQASLYADGNPGDYQTASSQAMLDSVLDSVMATPALSRDAENHALANRWKEELEEH